MIKYNVMIGSYVDIDNSDLDALIDEYNVKIINVEKKGKFMLYNYIISELDIIPFLSELPYDYFVKFIVDYVLLQMNLMHCKKNNTDIYRNPQHDKKPFYKLIQTDTENEIYHICRYIEQNFY